MGMSLTEEIRKCACCGKSQPVSGMSITMVAQMHRYVCDSTCMINLYKKR